MWNITRKKELFTIFFLLVSSALVTEALSSIGDGYYFNQSEGWKVSVKATSKMLVVLLCLIGILLRVIPLSAEAIMGSYVIGSLATIMWFFPWKLLEGFTFRSWSQVINILRESSSYALLIGTSFFYSRGDWFVIQQSLGNAALGMYGSGYRFLEGMSLVPAAVTQNLFPISDKKEGLAFPQLMKLTSVMTAMGCAAGLFLFFAANFLTTQLLGEAYQSSTVILQIFAGVVVLFFINSPLSTVVQSSKFVTRFLPFGIANTVLNLSLNIVLIPRFGLIAAASVMFLTELTGLLINFWFVTRIYKRSSL
jgi:O-antigen/teichoic acid export membrane protein